MYLDVSRTKLDKACARTAVRDGVLLVAIGVPLLFTGLGLSFLDPDEGLYGDIAREMLARRDWVLPRFNGLPYLEKPPLYFWLSAAALWAGAAPEWALRCWSAASALGTALLARAIAGRLYGRRAGLLAGLAFITTAGSALYVRKASTDFVFVFCLALALWGFVRDAQSREASPARFLLLYVGAALAVLAKGLIGAVFPALIVGASLLWARELTVRDLNVGRGAAVFAAVTVPWHVLVAWRDPTFFWFYLVDNQVLRFLNLRAFLEDDVPVSAIGFLAATFVWFFPWSVFVLARPGRPEAPSPWRAVPLIWAVVVIGFFALSRSRLEYYALPAFPALAVMVGGAWASGRDVGRWLAAGLAGCAAVGAAALWAGARLTADQVLSGLAALNVYYRILRAQGEALPFDSVSAFGLLLQLLGATLVVGWILAAACWWRGRRHGAFAALVGVGVAIGALVVHLLYVVEPHHSVKAVAGAIAARARADDVVVHEGSLEYSAALPLYTARRIVVVDGARGDLEFASRLPEARGYFVDATAMAAIWDGTRRVFLVTQRPPAHSVADRLPAGSVRLIGRFGSRWLYSNRGN